MSDHPITNREDPSIHTADTEPSIDVVPLPPRSPRAFSSWQVVRPSPPIPSRYRIREAEDGDFLVCDEAPRIRVSIRRDHSFSEAEARELGERTILLDGAGRFAPLLDNKTRLYNLDHHEGCERTFTLATCEQALLLVHSGLELGQGDWTVYANEPDLDTAIAIWCLLNYQRLTDLRQSARDILLPIIRLEGAIDANGAALAELCGLPRSLYNQTKERLDELLAIEQAARARGDWHTADPHIYTSGLLEAIDHLIYHPDEFREYASIDEVYGHVEIGGGRVAVACRDAAGIYEVETHLKKRWGDQLGVIALEKEAGHYTLRRTATLSSIDLRAAYRMLNLLDPAVDGRPPGKRWGGSDGIGGSPRPSGTLLSPSEILKLVRLAFAPRPRWRSLGRVVGMTLLSAAILLLGTLLGVLWLGVPAVSGRALEETVRIGSLALVAGTASWIVARRISQQKTWVFGWRRPAGTDWLGFAPLALLTAIPIRAWTPENLAPSLASLALGGAALALASIAVEFWFRGCVHGSLILDSRIQAVGGKWRISLATIVSGLLYTLVCVGASAPWIALDPFAGLAMRQELALVAVSAAVGGLALGIIRERSLSLWPGVVVLFLGGVVGTGLRIFF